MTQPDLMLAALRTNPGAVISQAEMSEAIWPLAIFRPRHWRYQLAAIASHCRKRGHHVENVQGMGWRLIEEAPR